MCIGKKRAREQLAKNQKGEKEDASNEGGTVSEKLVKARETFKETEGTIDKETVNRNVEEFLKAILVKGVDGQKSDFAKFSKWNPPELTYDNFNAEANKSKNRYLDISCQDQTRVKVNWPGLDNDYIHANFVDIKAGNEKKAFTKRFLCTQGPLKGTRHAFWAMICQEQVQVIIMLCSFIETSKEKCSRYFPEQERAVMKFGEGTGKIAVACGETKIMTTGDETSAVVCRRLILKYTNREGKEAFLQLRHYHWTNWPDRGVPKGTQTMTHLLSRCSREGKTAPIVVHCSAGIGRTGTLVAVAYITGKLSTGEKCEDPIEVLKFLRKQRAWSIQNVQQYLYIHRAIFDYFFEKYGERFGAIKASDPEMEEAYEKWIADYEMATNA